MEIVVSSSFEPLLWDESPVLVMCGGRGSGKSEFAGRKLFVRGEKEAGHRFLVVRKIRRTCSDSVVFLIKRILDENGVSYDYNKTDHTIVAHGPAGPYEFVFVGLDDPEKIKSFTGMTSAWIEEATELTRDDFLKLDLCLREPGPSYRQIMLTFNPQEVEARWLKDAFFGAAPYPGARVHNSTIDDNPLKRLDPKTWAAYAGKLDALRDQDEALWKISRLGLWAARSGQIFSWDVADLPKDAKFDDVFLGGDFGYSVDPSGLVRIHRKADEFWLEELLYAKNLTNQDLSREMELLGVQRREPSYWDSAEPKSIEELRRLGWNAAPAQKGQDSVRAGIDFIKSKKVHIVTGSHNLKKEHDSYCWRKDRGGQPMSEPVAFDDHLMSAVRYGIFTRCARPQSKIWTMRAGV